MSFLRAAAGAGLLVGEAGLAALGVLFHYGLTVEYGDVTHSALEGLSAGFTAGVNGIALVLVGVFAVCTLLVARGRGMRLTAMAVPVLMVLGMLAVTPAALREKLAVQYDATPHCVSEEHPWSGPGGRAARESQRSLDSIEHVGQFGGGGGSGLGGCDRTFVMTTEVDVLQHYRGALRRAGWQVVQDEEHRLRAERQGSAVEVTTCGRGGVVWAGSVGDSGGAQCHRH
jgi:hypothetical protein